MFYYINKNKIIQWVAITGLLAWAIAAIILQMSILPACHQAYLYTLCQPWLAVKPWAYKGLSIAMLLLTMFCTQRFFSINKFSDNETFMPIVFLLLLFNMSHAFSTFTPVYFTVLTTAFIIMMNSENEHNIDIKNRTFASGILIGINTLFDYNAIWLIPLMIIVLIVSRFSKIKEIAILLTGVLFIYLYLFTYAYLTDQVPAIFGKIKEFAFFTVLHQIPSFRWMDWVFIAVWGSTSLLFLFGCKLYFDNKVVVLRKRYILCILLLIFAIFMGIFSPFEMQVSLPYLLLPTAILFSIIVLIEDRKWVHDIFIIATCLFLWL